jgi:DNA-binding GntR family transcriptional regulator
MAPDAVTQERIYHALKREFGTVSHRWAARLDLQMIADRHRASTTPVREAVHRLMGERLIEPRGDGGFQRVVPDIAQLHDLYLWHRDQLMSALGLASLDAIRDAVRTGVPVLTPSSPGDEAEAFATLFAAIARAPGNAEYLYQIEAANERLRLPRFAESLLFRDGRRELRAFVRPTAGDMRAAIRRRIISYHQRRIDHVEQISHICRNQM